MAIFNQKQKQCLLEYFDQKVMHELLIAVSFSKRFASYLHAPLVQKFEHLWLFFGC